jgi:FlaG/FlaF family flagellin (archaellin)
MQSNRVRIIAGMLVVAVAVLLFIVLGGGSSSNNESPSGKVEVINIKDGKPLGGIKQLSYNKGNVMRIRVNARPGDEVHLHGYNVLKTAPSAGSVTFTVPARIEGVFEMELEKTPTQIANIKVNP